MKEANDNIQIMSDYNPGDHYEVLAERIKHLNKLLWKTFKMPEEDKTLLVAGSLLALSQEAFLTTYVQLGKDALPQAWFNAIVSTLEGSPSIQHHSQKLRQPFASIATLPALSTWAAPLSSNEGSPLAMLLSWLHEHIKPLIEPEHGLDILSRVYMQVGLQSRSKKLLGIVLTPPHIGELFCELANLTENDTVLDMCAGSGALLLSTGGIMCNAALPSHLIGIEQDEKMFALLAANTLLSCHARLTIIFGSCFDESTLNKLKEREIQGKSQPNIGFLNPPYAQPKSNPALHELYFVKHMLDQLSPGGLGIAIVPMSCATLPHTAKHEILKDHRLKAVMSMPLESFHPVKIGTCIMVFEPHNPHMENHQATWLGYWRDDGFVKTKDKGRIDLHNRWQAIKSNWLAAYRNRAQVPGQGVNALVTASDEWVAEAYLETDYSTLQQSDFEKVVKNYALYKLFNEERHG